MTSIINDNAQTALFLALTALIWGDWYAPTVSIWADYQLFKLWREKWKRHMWLPPMVFFAIFIVATYAALQAALYAYFLNINADDPVWARTAVTFLFAFFLAFTKRWLAIYMIGGRMVYAALVLLLAVATSVPVMALFGIYGHFQELYCMIPYMLFLLGALYLNLRSLWVEHHHPTFCSAISKEKWYKKTATYDLESKLDSEQAHGKINL